MRVLQIAGFLGSGKTTALLLIAKKLHHDHTKRVALVVNELGEIPVDGKVVEESELNVKTIGGGCICCEVSATFQRTLGVIAREFSPDIVIAEPTGVAIPHQVKLVAAMGGRDYKVTLGPAIVLFDATRAELLSEDALGKLIKAQLVDADYMVISKVDIATPEDIAHSIEMIGEVNPKAEIYKFSAITEEGLDKTLDVILNTPDFPLPSSWGSLR
jgi:G3E family GTPase